MDTIYALSTGVGKAGVAIIRLSGGASAAAVRALCGVLPAPRRAVLTRIRHPASQELIDQGLVLWFPGPASFTGEDVAELHIHGGRAVIAATLGALAVIDGTRAAEAGEFTRRAFANGRLDLTEIEGLSDLLDALTEQQRRAALRAAIGVHRALYEDWTRRITGAQALIEAAIDFSDEGDVPAETRGAMLDVVKKLNAEIAVHLQSIARGRILRDGVQVVIAGPPNAGKSSLLNWFAQKEVAIVTEQPGTTRDVIDVHLDLDGIAFTISDTAGLRISADPVEVEGMRRTRARMGHADLVLWLSEDGAASAEGRVPVWSFRSKHDLQLADDLAASGLSTVTGFGLDRLLQDLQGFGRDLVGDADGAPVMIRERHRLSFFEATGYLQRVLAADISYPLEFIAEDLRLAAMAIGRVTGRIDVEDVLGEIFARFCVGK